MIDSSPQPIPVNRDLVLVVADFDVANLGMHCRENDTNLRLRLNSWTTIRKALAQHRKKRVGYGWLRHLTPR